MDTDRCRELFGSQRVARLATVGPDGPHIVPIVFALADDHIVTAVDHKPKRTTQLQRLANIASNQSVSILVDHYDDDWDRLWWVRADGVATVTSPDEVERDHLDVLVSRYPQYQPRRPSGPVIDVMVTRWTGWSAT